MMKRKVKELKYEVEATTEPLELLASQPFTIFCQGRRQSPFGRDRITGLHIPHVTAAQRWRDPLKGLGLRSQQCISPFSFYGTLDMPMDSTVETASQPPLPEPPSSPLSSSSLPIMPFSSFLLGSAPRHDILAGVCPCRPTFFTRPPTIHKQCPNSIGPSSSSSSSSDVL